MLSLAACGGGTPTESSANANASGSCSTVGQNTFVRDTLQDIYFWYRNLPAADPARYTSPEAYLDAVRYRPLDEFFSYINSKAADTAFFSESQFIGLGISSIQTSATEVRLSQVFPGSPASEVGLDRGDYLLVDQRPDRPRPDPDRGDQLDLRRERGRRPRRPHLAAPRRGRDERHPDQARGDDPHRFRHAHPDPGRPARRLRPLPQLRPALDGRAQHRLLRPARGGSERARARPALQRRRARERGPAPGRAHRGRAHERRGLRGVLPQRQERESQQRAPLPGSAPGPRSVPGRDHHHALLGVRQRGDGQQPAALHRGGGGRQHHLRQARRASTASTSATRSSTRWPSR